MTDREVDPVPPTEAEAATRPIDVATIALLANLDRIKEALAIARSYAALRDEAAMKTYLRAVAAGIRWELDALPRCRAVVTDRATKAASFEFYPDEMDNVS